MEESFIEQLNKTVKMNVSDYKDIEKTRWELFAEKCFAKMGKTCTISQEYCYHDVCFARQLLTLTRGYL